MKVNIAIICILLLTRSCANNNTRNPIATDQDTVNRESDIQQATSTSICFQRVDGNSNQDTTTISLNINGEDVSGDFRHIPYEKDSRIGTLKGKRNGDQIKALWTFMQEGITDTLSVEFKLIDEKLLQKTFSIDPVEGRQFISDTSRFLIPYNKIECSIK